jgi:hypothetical protein
MQGFILLCKNYWRYITLQGVSKMWGQLECYFPVRQTGRRIEQGAAVDPSNRQGHSVIAEIGNQLISGARWRATTGQRERAVLFVIPRSKQVYTERAKNRRATSPPVWHLYNQSHLGLVMCPCFCCWDYLMKFLMGLMAMQHTHMWVILKKLGCEIKYPT